MKDLPTQCRHCKSDRNSLNEQGDCRDCEIEITRLRVLPLNELQAIRIEDVRMGGRSANLVRNTFIETIGELLEISENRLRKFRSWGRPVTEVQQWLAKFGLELAASTSPKLLETLAERRANWTPEPHIPDIPTVRCKHCSLESDLLDANGDCEDCIEEFARLRALPLEEIRGLRLNDVRLGVRLANLLDNIGIKTLGELLDMSGAELAKRRSSYPHNVERWLAKIGHKLAPTANRELLKTLAKRRAKWIGEPHNLVISTVRCEHCSLNVDLLDANGDCEDCIEEFARLRALPLEEIRGLRLNDVRLGVRLANLFYNTGIETLGELLEMSSSELAKHRSCPHDDVERWLAKIGHGLMPIANPELLETFEQRRSAFWTLGLRPNRSSNT